MIKHYIRIILIFFNFIIIVFQDRLQDDLKYFLGIYKISVITPIFNSEIFLKLTLNSIMNQTLKNIEIICIDDGSTDNSLMILKEYQQFEKRLKILTQNNQGSGVARNNGINLSKGKYIAFMDSDDLYPNNFTLELLYNKAKKNKAIICGGGLNEFDNLNKTLRLLEQKENFTFNTEGFINYLDYQYDYGYYRFIYDLKFIKKNKILFPKYLRYQDPPFFIKAMALSKKFYALNEITYYYRKSNKIWSEQKIIDQYKGFHYSLQLCQKYNLTKLYCIIIGRLNTQIFLLPTKLFIKSKQLKNIINQILKNINYDLLQKEKVFFELNNIYQNI